MFSLKNTCSYVIRILKSAHSFGHLGFFLNVKTCYLCVMRIMSLFKGLSQTIRKIEKSIITKFKFQGFFSIVSIVFWNHWTHPTGNINRNRVTFKYMYSTVPTRCPYLLTFYLNRSDFYWLKGTTCIIYARFTLHRPIIFFISQVFKK